MRQLSFIAPGSGVEGSSIPSAGEWRDLGKKSGDRQKLGDQFTFSTFRLQTKYSIFIITKGRERKLA